ncbi:MAG: PAS domain S-box protein [Candidatus Methanoperedens sp.]|nr:PAS domain S-box protein [Candidatus Methanoperedens sp.]
MTKKNHTLKVLTTIVSIFLIGYLLESYRHITPQAGDFFEISTELLPFVMSFSIFVLTWHAYAKNMDPHPLFIGASLLIIGTFDMYHMLSHPYMPDFITPNSQQKEAVFWGAARLISALLFFASVFIYKGSLPRWINKPVLLISINILNIVLLNTMLLFPEYLPAMHYPDGSFSTAWTLLAFLTSAIILYTGYLYSRRFLETGQKSIVCLIYGFIILAFSNLVYSYYEYSGHLLKAAGYFFIYLALFKSSIEQPYEKEVVTEKELRYETEEKYRSLFENASDAIIMVDLEDNVTSWNTSAERIFGWTAEEAVGKKNAQLIVPGDLVQDKDLFIYQAKSGRSVSGIETVRVRKDGTRLEVSLAISPIRDANQNVIGFSSITRDITERKRAEDQIKQSLKEKEVLLREIHHRVKNNMQIISSLLRLQSESITEEKYLDMFKDCQNRVISMSLVHEKLYYSKDFTKIDFNEYVNDMVDGLFESYGLGRVVLKTEIEDTLDMDSAIPCGLIVNELVTNSLKYAFPDGRKGEIRIALKKTGGEMGLTVGDNGIGFPEELDFRKTESLGLQLVNLLVNNQLEGHINLDRSKGTEFQIRFKGAK